MADEDDDLFRCTECGHGWNCVLDTGGDDRYECPNCGHDTGVDAPPYAKPYLPNLSPSQGTDMKTYCCYGAYADIGHSEGCTARTAPPWPERKAALGPSLLRPPSRPPKPRLRPCMGIWTCETANLIAKGRTPAEAYREWQKAVAIRGAEVMRSLRPFA